MQEFTRVGMVD